MSTNDKVFNLQTDAISEPPRIKNETSVSDKQNVNIEQNAAGDIDAKLIDEVPVRPSRRKHSSKTNVLGQDANTAKCIPNGDFGNGTSGNVINVINSKQVHIGARFDFTIANAETLRDSKSNKSNKDFKETKTVKAVKSSTEKCTITYIDIVKTHLGTSWKSVFRQLAYSEGEIDTFYVDHFNNGGLSEVIYQALLDWTRNNPDEATLGKLCTILWENKSYEVVQKVASKWKSMNT